MRRMLLGPPDGAVIDDEAPTGAISDYFFDISCRIWRVLWTV